MLGSEGAGRAAAASPSGQQDRACLSAPVPGRGQGAAAAAEPSQPAEAEAVPEEGRNSA